MTLEDIGENDTAALLCVTNLTACCRPYTGENGSAIGDWFFPNETRVPNECVNATKWDFFRDRGKMMVLLHRRKGGVDGIYRCEIPDSMNVIQTIYIGVYTANTGKLHCTLILFFLYCYAYVAIMMALLLDLSRTNIYVILSVKTTELQ